MATIFWRGDTAYLNWRKNGRQKRESLGQISKYDAETRRQQKELEIRLGRPLFQSSELFGVTAVRYLDWHRTQYPDSNERTRFVIEHRFSHLHDRPLATITQLEIDEWVTKRAKQVASGTVTKELNTLKAFLNKAVEWEKLAKNPAVYVRAPANVESEPIHWYSTAELQRLYKVDPLHADTWQFLANIGLRRREAMQLRWDDIRDGSIWLVSKKGARTKSAKWRQWVMESISKTEQLPVASTIPLRKSTKDRERESINSMPASLNRGSIQSEPVSVSKNATGLFASGKFLAHMYSTRPMASSVAV